MFRAKLVADRVLRAPGCFTPFSDGAVFNALSRVFTNLQTPLHITKLSHRSMGNTLPLVHDEVVASIVATDASMTAVREALVTGFGACLFLTVGNLTNPHVGLFGV